MTGLQIANNLAKNRLRWVKNHFFKKEKGPAAYCVVGQKLHEVGVSDELLKNIGGYIEVYAPEGMSNETVFIPDPDDFIGLADLIGLNDVSKSKKDLIKKLRSKEWAKRKFNMEGCRRDFLSAQKKMEAALLKFKK